MFPHETLTEAATQTSPHDLSMEAALVRFVLALMLGAVLAYRPWRRWMPNAPPRSLETTQTQLLLAVVGAVMTTVIGDSMSRAFGLVGLGGVIRFRSGIKDPRDAAVMFMLIGVGMSCGLGAFRIAACVTCFMSAVLMFLDMSTQGRTQLIKLSLDVEDLTAVLPPLRALHPNARVLTLEQGPQTQAGTAVVELVMPERMDGYEFIQGLRGALPGVRSASIDPG